MRSAKLGLLITALAVLGALAISGASATDNGGAEVVRGASRFQSLVIDKQVPVRTMQSLYFTVTVLALFWASVIGQEPNGHEGSGCEERENMGFTRSGR